MQISQRLVVRELRNLGEAGGQQIKDAVSVLLEGLKPMPPGRGVFRFDTLDQGLLGAAGGIGGRQPEQGQIIRTLKPGSGFFRL